MPHKQERSNHTINKLCHGKNEGCKSSNLGDRSIVVVRPASRQIKFLQFTKVFNVWQVHF